MRKAWHSWLPGQAAFTVAEEGLLQEQNTGEARRKMTHQRLFLFEHPHRRSFLYVCVRGGYVTVGVCLRTPLVCKAWGVWICALTFLGTRRGKKGTSSLFFLPSVAHEITVCVQMRTVMGEWIRQFTFPPLVFSFLQARWCIGTGTNPEIKICDITAQGTVNDWDHAKGKRVSTYCQVKMF